MDKFNPKYKVECLSCGETIFSDYNGGFVTCSCQKCYIDETDGYCRVGGDIETYKLFRKNKNNEFERIEAWWEKTDTVYK